MSGSKPCPSCKARTAGIRDSRPSKDGNVLWRRVYVCGACGHRFTTHEVVVAEVGQVTITPAHRAQVFMEEVEALARRYFGDEKGSWRTAGNTGVNLKRAAP